MTISGIQVLFVVQRVTGGKLDITVYRYCILNELRHDLIGNACSYTSYISPRENSK